MVTVVLDFPDPRWISFFSAFLPKVDQFFSGGWITFLLTIAVVHKGENIEVNFMTLNSRIKPRIFLGIEEIGDYTLRLAQGFRELGFDVTNVITERNRPSWQHANNSYNRTLAHGNRFIGAKNLVMEFIYSFLSHDVFIFCNGGSFMSHLLLLKPMQHLAYADLFLLKKLRKKIVIVTVGSDIRSPKLYLEYIMNAGFTYSYYLGMEPNDLKDDIKRTRAKKISKYADHIFSQPSYAHLLQKPYHFLWFPINLETVTYNLNMSPNPLIVHAPSSRRGKGTKLILDAIDQLIKDGYCFKFKLCENMSNLELRKLLAEAEIVIDQLDPLGYGLLGVEAMASGCVLVGGGLPGFIWPDDFPGVSVTPPTLATELQELLKHPERRTELAQKGRAYVEKYHDHRIVARDFLKTIDIEVSD